MLSWIYESALRDENDENVAFNRDSEDKMFFKLNKIVVFASNRFFCLITNKI